MYIDIFIDVYRYIYRCRYIDIFIDVYRYIRQNSSRQPGILPSSDSREIRKSGNVFNFLENDVSA